MKSKPHKHIWIKAKVYNDNQDGYDPAYEVNHLPNPILKSSFEYCGLCYAKRKEVTK